MNARSAPPRPFPRLRPLLAALALICLLPRLALPVRAESGTGAERSRLTSAEEQLLALTLAEYAPESTFAARVGMAAAVLGRMESPAYPDALTDVLAGLRSEGAFGTTDGSVQNGPPQDSSPQDGSPQDGSPQDRRYLSARRGTMRAVRNLLSDGLARIVGTGSGAEAERRLTELSLHAVRMAEEGADPTGGALCFRVVRIPRARDFLFNDAGEDARLAKLGHALRDYPIVLGDAGFR